MAPTLLVVSQCLGIGRYKDIPNWILDESSRFTIKSAKIFFLDLGAPCGWGKLIWSSYIPPPKTLILWKKFHGRLHIDQHIKHKGLHICFICRLCEK